ncbi:related to Free methionine-R-sulfoxide reductase [Rhynchosporium agropyri]|uniref:Related to Free methionine-R-sulfoxide reductase n=1 Tax=Rhynchosporium agropyri TaxID=914238 RepID=A0A1E1LEZ1_9HELO|nr:related to Free methionine-R-sulfoxide reductase [Rhynchosporium agropyri]
MVLEEGKNPKIFNLANAASLLWHAYNSLPSPSADVNWAGFYVLDSKPPTSPATGKPRQQLILGPFQGKVACQTILFGRGVCGTAASERRTQLVPDVEAFPGHIACDGDSKSEIVVPILRNGTEEEVVAIIDIDCAVLNGFDETDQIWLEKLAVLLGGACDW